MSVMACVLAFPGYVLLALAMDRHHRQVWQVAPSARRRIRLRVAGVVAVSASLAFSVAEWGGTIGLAAWCCLSTLLTLSVSILLAYRPGWLLWMGGGIATVD